MSFRHPLIVKRTRDVDQIKAVLCHPDIYPCIDDDSSPAMEDYEPPMSAEYIAGMVYHKVIGILIYTNNHYGKEIHIQVLPKYRKEYARSFANAGLSYNIETVYAQIPVCFANVIKFTKEFGFIKIATLQNAYKKLGEVCDIHIFVKYADSENQQIESSGVNHGICETINRQGSGQSGHSSR